MQAVPFAPYDALYREALTTASPFYRLLCAWKMYEGTNRLRRWIREQCENRGIKDRMPSDPAVDQSELVKMGFSSSFAQGIRHASDLFSKLGEQRNAIAHFLFDVDGGESHVYLADGSQLVQYAVASSAMLRYAHAVLEELRLFCVGRIPFSTGSTILPLPANRDQFVVRASDHGVE
jgi:hypothetical protein